MVLMGIGIWLRVDPKMYEPTRFIQTDNYIAGAWIMMITGFIIVIIGFCGCYGAVTESSCILCFVSFLNVLNGLRLDTDSNRSMYRIIHVSIHCILIQYQSHLIPCLFSTVCTSDVTHDCRRTCGGSVGSVARIRS